jgi:hypothetical protein
MVPNLVLAVLRARAFNRSPPVLAEHECDCAGTVSCLCLSQRLGGTVASWEVIVMRIGDLDLVPCGRTLQHTHFPSQKGSPGKTKARNTPDLSSAMR